MGNLFSKKLVSRKLEEISVRDLNNKSKKYKVCKMQDFIYSLTEQGGDVWSIERTPIWKKYCNDTVFYDESKNAKFQ